MAAQQQVFRMNLLFLKWAAWMVAGTESAACRERSRPARTTTWASSLPCNPPPPPPAPIPGRRFGPAAKSPKGKLDLDSWRHSLWSKTTDSAPCYSSRWQRKAQRECQLREDGGKMGAFLLVPVLSSFPGKQHGEGAG